MKRLLLAPLLLTLLVSCSSKDKTFIERRDDCAELAGRKVTIEDFIKKYNLASMEGYKVVDINDHVHEIDIFVSATGNLNVINHGHMEKMKNGAIVCNIGHFDNEIDVASLKKYEWENVKPQVDQIIFPDGKKIILLAEGRLVNLGCATGHPSFVMSASFTNQVIAQIELWINSDKYDKKVYVLPKHLDEKVAMLHLEKVGAKLTQLSKDQADYISVNQEGPYKPDAYRY